MEKKISKISNNFNNWKNEYYFLNKTANINQSQNNNKLINNYIHFKNDKNLIINNKNIINNSKTKNNLISKSQANNNRLIKMGNNIINISKKIFPKKDVPLKIHNSKDNNINIISHKFEENLRYNNIYDNQMMNYNNLYKLNNFNSNNIQKFSPSLDFAKKTRSNKSCYIFGKRLNEKKKKENNVIHPENKFKYIYDNKNKTHSHINRL